jgi:hypothetical protein
VALRDCLFTTFTHKPKWTLLPSSRVNSQHVNFVIWLWFPENSLYYAWRIRDKFRIRNAWRVGIFDNQAEILLHAGKFRVLLILFTDTMLTSWGRDSSVCIALDDLGIESGRGGEIFRNRPDWLWSLPGILYIGYQVYFPGLSGRDVALTTHPHLAPRFKKEYSHNSTRLWAFMAC